MSDNGRYVNYETLGDGPPVILIHGMGASLRQWDFLMPELAGAGFSTFALDLQGHGESPKPSGVENYHIEVYFEQLSLWIDNLELERPAIFVAHSLGGHLSLMYALRNPEKVHALVLADPFYSPFQLSPVVRYFANRPGIGSQLLDWLPTWVLETFMYGSEKVQQALPGFVRHQLAKDYKRATPLSLYVTRTIRDLTPRLSRIQHPTLVMWGSRDMTLAPDSFTKIIAELPKAERFIFPGCGHIPHLTQPAIFNQQVLDFVIPFSDNGKS